jgi:uncharacterized membrane protein
MSAIGIEGFERPTPLAAEAASPAGKWGERVDVRSYSKVLTVRLLRVAAAIFFVAAGANHFVNPDFYRKIVPPGFGSPAVLVAVSGVAEIAGGMGLLIPRLRRWAGWGLIALLIAVFPANVYMAVSPQSIPDLHFSRWTLWLRLPLQGVFMVWVWYAGLRTDRLKSGAR